MNLKESVGQTVSQSESKVGKKSSKQKKQKVVGEESQEIKSRQDQQSHKKKKKKDCKYEQLEVKSPEHKEQEKPEEMVDKTSSKKKNKKERHSLAKESTENNSKNPTFVQTQKKDESAKKKSKRTKDASKEGCSTSEQKSKDTEAKRTDTNSSVPKQNALMIPRSLTKKAIDKAIDNNQKSKSVDKPVGQRLFEISQNSKVYITPKLAEKPKGHIRFSSSGESSSSSDSDSESSSSEEDSNKSSKANAKGRSVTLSTSVVAMETAYTQWTAVKDQTAKMPNFVTDNHTNKNKPPLQSTKSPNVDLATDVTSNHTNNGKPSHNATYSESTDSDKDSTTLPTMVTKNGATNGLGLDVASKENESWPQGNQRGGRGRRRQQRGWNPLSKKGQLNTQLTNKSILFQVSTILKTMTLPRKF